MHVTKINSNTSTIKRHEIIANQIKKKTSNVKFALDYFWDDFVQLDRLFPIVPARMISPISYPV